MSEWKKVKIGDMFSIEKGSLQSSKCTPGEYDFITAATDWKTHNSFDHECEAIVYAVAASGSLGRAHYVNGKFIASDLCFILTEKDKKQYPINFLFYQIVFEMLRDEIVSKTKTGTSKESINRGNFSNYEIPYFPIEFQLANYQKFVNAKNIVKNLLKEAEVQKNYIKQLRQNILQQAIEGKLTADLRKQNPVQKGNPDYDAEALFEQIQKERNNGKKQKELSQIIDEEKPFEIPEGWKWVRLGEICKKLTDGSHNPPPNTGKGFPVISAMNIKNGEITFDKVARYTDEKGFEKENKRTNITRGDLIMGIIGASIGNIAIYNHDEKVIAQRSIAIIDSYLNNSYIEVILNSIYIQTQLQEKTFGSAQGGVYLGKISNLQVPLSPLNEQSEIVIQVENYLNKINVMEKQIVEREDITKQLMQTILKDVFEEN